MDPKQTASRLARIAATLVLASIGAVRADCFDAAASRHEVPSELLRAIACVESNFDHHAYNDNRNGSYDIGIMQINSIWLPELSRFDIVEDHLWDMCTNVPVGAWVLSQKIAAFGYTARAIGAYNAGLRDTPTREYQRYEYAKKVYRAVDHGCE